METPVAFIHKLNNHGNFIVITLETIACRLMAEWQQCASHCSLQWYHMRVSAPLITGNWTVCLNDGFHRRRASNANGVFMMSSCLFFWKGPVMRTTLPCHDVFIYSNFHLFTPRQRANFPTRRQHTHSIVIVRSNIAQDKITMIKVEDILKRHPTSYGFAR